MKEIIFVIIGMITFYVLGHLFLPKEPYNSIQQELIKMEEEQ
tara:strand:- start:649 stop:774 length:126 start_codon:yes stop_codon:yes gene_type:complete